MADNKIGCFGTIVIFVVIGAIGNSCNGGSSGTSSSSSRTVADVILESYDYDRSILTLNQENSSYRFKVPKNAVITEKVKQLANDHYQMSNGKEFNEKEYLPFVSLKNDYKSYAELMYDTGGVRWPQKTSFETAADYQKRIAPELDKFHKIVSNLFSKVYASLEVCSENYNAASGSLSLRNSIGEYERKLNNGLFNVEWKNVIGGYVSDQKSQFIFAPIPYQAIDIAASEAQELFGGQKCMTGHLYGFVSSIDDWGQGNRGAEIYPIKFKLGDRFFQIPHND